MDKMNILQINTSDIGGGAEKVAYNLYHKLKDKDRGSWMVVGYKRGNDKDTFEINNFDARSSWARYWLFGKELQEIQKSGKITGTGKVRQFSCAIGDPIRGIQRFIGSEDYNYPGTKKIFDLVPGIPDIVHCHNLHGGYFDLRVLPEMKKKGSEIFFTLHDAWLLGGHCTHSFNCERWQTGCGKCPDLTIPQAIRYDNTFSNLKRKVSMLSDCGLNIITPSKWLMDKVNNSLLSRIVKRKKVIPNGVDLDIYHPGDKDAMKRELGLPLDRKIVLFVSKDIKRNIYRDYETIKRAANNLKGFSDEKVIFVALGDMSECSDEEMVKFVPFNNKDNIVAKYYQASDIYLHASKADTFPNSVIEALASSLPVVATGVGGIREQINGLSLFENDHSGNVFTPDEATGVLLPAFDDHSMAFILKRLLEDDEILRKMSNNAVQNARSKYDLDVQIIKYITFYKEVLESE